MGPAAVLLVALVAEDGTALRSAADDAAPAQAMLYRGDWLEVRGEAPGFLKVWDHRHQRPGYVRPAAVRVHRAEEASAGELHAVVRFVREAAGMESLGVGYAALYLKVAPPGRRMTPEWAEVLGAMGAMSDRLGRRATGARRPIRRAVADATLAGQLGVLESYGVRFLRFEHAERTVLCYDGDAFARVLALPAAPAEERAQAALALTRRACLDPAATPAARRAWNQARVDLLTGLDGLGAAKNGLGRLSAHRVRLRAVDAFAERAHDEATQGRGEDAARAAAEAMRRLALVDKGELAPEDRPRYDEAALRAAAVRWLAEPPLPPGQRPLRVEIVASRPGETCVRVRPSEARAKDPGNFPERCTFGLVFPSSLRWSPSGRVATIAVAPLPSWTELWILRAVGDDRGRVDVVPPALGSPGDDIGYAEVAGFSPDGRRLLVARAFRLAGRLGHRFEVLGPDAVTVERSASTPDRLTAFKRWASPLWRKTTLAAR